HSDDLHRRCQRRTKPRTCYQHRSLSLHNAITGAAKGGPGWTQPQNPDGAQQEGSRDQRWAHSPKLRPVGEACPEIGRSPGRGKSKPHPPGESCWTYHVIQKGLRTYKRIRIILPCFRRRFVLPLCKLLIRMVCTKPIGSAVYIKATLIGIENISG
ncbi:unnamed protein product, partial [Pylaiella littoralis]